MSTTLPATIHVQHVLTAIVQHVLTAIAVNIERLSQQEPADWRLPAPATHGVQQYLDAHDLPRPLW